MSQPRHNWEGPSSPTSPSMPSGSRHAPFLGLAGPSISSPIPTLSSLASTPGESLSSPKPLVKRDKQPQQAGPRIIRTFEEIKVPVNSEEWYEELECPICSQILGATQSIVPCGHSFCGPCCWKWLKSTEHPNCPSCRVEVTEHPSFVPNILIDQIIDRKLAGLPESTEKNAMTIERKEKAQAWKVIQASITPSKAAPKRTRGLDNIMSDLMELAAPTGHRNGHSRRASRHLPELGAPVASHSNQDLEAEARLRSERIRNRLDDMRRLREERIRFLTAVADDRSPTDAGGFAIERPNSSSMQRDQRLSPPRISSSASPESLSYHRAGGYRSPALARRQARGRPDHGTTRDDPLVVLSDEEED